MLRLTADHAAACYVARLAACPLEHARQTLIAACQGRSMAKFHHPALQFAAGAGADTATAAAACLAAWLVASVCQNLMKAY
jgi:hypothetical protein